MYVATVLSSKDIIDIDGGFHQERPGLGSLIGKLRELNPLESKSFSVVESLGEDPRIRALRGVLKRDLSIDGGKRNLLGRFNFNQPNLYFSDELKYRISLIGLELRNADRLDHQRRSEVYHFLFDLAVELRRYSS